MKSLQCSRETDQWQELNRKVAFLQRADSYPEKTSEIKSIQTHMSWVFLTDEHAYKLKKPVDLHYLKLCSLEARRLNAEKEISLNQDLAPGIYLKTIPLILTKEQKLQVGGPVGDGRIVDWLVLMKRFPQDQTLEQKMLRNDLNWSQIREAAQFISQFYLKAESVNISGEAYCSRLERYVRENYQALSQKRYGLDQDEIDKIHKAQLECLLYGAEAFYKRVLEGRIIEGHGDLRPEHICLNSPPIIVDRLEFNQELRTLDPVDELSYLTIECSFLGYPEIGECFMHIYRETTHDQIDERVIGFYRSFRSSLRAKISLWHLDDERVLNKDKFKKKAALYLNFAKKILE